MTTEQKARCWELVVAEYGKDSDIAQFGRDVQDIIKNARKFYPTRSNRDATRNSYCFEEGNRG